MALTPAQRSARASLAATFSAFGLRSLVDWAWRKYLAGVPMEQIMLDMRDRPEYKTRFPGLEALRKKGRAISEAAYVEYERSAASMMRAAGLPRGFYDRPDDFGRFIGQEVSLAELQERVTAASSIALSQPPDVRAEFARIYGAEGTGAIAAYFLDAGRALPVLQERYEASLAAGAAVRTGYGQLSRSEAEMVAGLDPGDAAGTFGALAGATELYSPLDTGEDAITRAEQLRAGFAGDVGAQQRIARRGARRKAVFEAGGSYASDREGLTGLGSAST